MGAELRNRIRRLAACDRLLLVLTCCWCIAGVTGNHFRHRGIVDGRWQVLVLFVMALWAAIAGVIAYSVIRRQRGLAAYGFSFRGGGVVSLAILAAVHLYLVMSGKLVLSAGGSFLLITSGAFMEEIVFRAIAIDNFIVLLDGTKAKAFWAILASSVLWSAMHISSKSPAELQGIFSGALILGYVYYKSRSILLPAWIHGVANAGYLGGVLIAGLYCLLAAADCLAGRTRRAVAGTALRQVSG